MPKTILIVDDSDFVRMYHSCILEEADFKVITASDGNDGLEKLYTNSCDLVLTDLNMENMDGYEFIRRVRSDNSFQNLPIVIVSTENSSEDKMKGYEAGANLYIVKPCEPATMVENVKMMLAEVGG